MCEVDHIKASYNSVGLTQPTSVAEDIEMINLLNASAASISFEEENKKNVHRAEMHLDDSI